MSVDRSRALRQISTAPERKLWTLLRSLKPVGFHFRRQVPVGLYFADFACHHAKLIIEVDGHTHGTDAAIAYDQARDAFLCSVGYEVVRFTNLDVMQNLEGVGIAIEQALKGRTTLPTPTRLPPPSPQGGGARLASHSELVAPSSPSPLRGGIKGGGRAANTQGAGQRAFRKADP
jgi:very-short-patch-repair endonuclease